MRKTFTAIVATLCLLPARAQTEVAPFVPGSTLEGVCYYLPQTALRVTVTAERTVTRPGEFYRYASRYLRLQGVPQEESVSWSIKEISMEPYGVPDKEKAYSIRVKSKTVAPLVGLSKDGILLSINAEAQETALPAPPQGKPAPALPNPKDFMTQEILSAGSVAKQAELCAQEIYDIRESRNALTRGEAENTPKDGAQLKLMLDQLDQQAAVLESLFAGTTQTSTEVFTLHYLPTKTSDRELLFRFSSKLGAVDADNLAGEPIYIGIKSMETIPAPVEDPQVSKKKEKMQQGVWYNVPQRIEARIYSAEKEWAKMETPMGQFGTVEVLAGTLFDKKSTIQVTFFQTTGGTKDIMQ